MCHECDDEYMDNEMNMISPEEMEDFIDFACLQVSKAIDKAEDKGFLYQLITEWPRERQAAFALATILEERLNSSWQEERE
jgi:hypothetical protein